MAERMEKTMAVVTNAKQLAMNRRRRLPADKMPFPCLTACVFTPASPFLLRSTAPTSSAEPRPDTAAEPARTRLYTRSRRSQNTGQLTQCHGETANGQTDACVSPDPPSFRPCLPRHARQPAGIWLARLPSRCWLQRLLRSPCLYPKPPPFRLRLRTLARSLRPSPRRSR